MQTAGLDRACVCGNSEIQFLSLCMRERIHLCQLDHSAKTAGKATVELVL